LLDAVQLALAQLGTAAGQADAVAAGVGEEERAVLVGDLGVMAGQVTLVVLDAPVAILGPADLATGAAKGLVRRVGAAVLAFVEQFENQFHGQGSLRSVVTVEGLGISQGAVAVVIELVVACATGQGERGEQASKLARQ
jgi:hypothetical protein